MSSSSPFSAGSSPFPTAGGGDASEEELASLSAYVNTAVASGYLKAEDVDSVTDRSNLVQRIMQWTGPEANNSGSMLETVGDILNAPVSAVYSAAKQKTVNDARLAAKRASGEGEAVQDFLSGLSTFDLDAIQDRGLLKSKFGIQTAVSAWQNKQTPSTMIRDAHMFDSGAATFGAGLVADVAFDPTTYLTFGIGAGTKVALSGAAKASLRPAARELSHVTLTRFGKRVYDEAVQEIGPRFLDETGEAIGSAPLGVRWHAEATEHMVANFERLKGQVLEKSRRGLWGRLTTGTPLTEAGRLSLQETVAQSTRKVAGLSVDELFSETSSHALELGLYKVPQAQKFLAGLKLPASKLLPQELAKLDVGRPFRWVFDTFDRGWDAPPDVVEQARLAFYASNDELARHGKRYYETFAKLSKEERELIPRVIEQRAGLSPMIHGQISDEAEAAVSFFTKEMDDILETERKAGFQTGEVDGYVSHMYAFNPHLRELALGVIRKNGEDAVKAVSRFTKQRMIASIAEGEEVFGDGALITDAYKLIMARRKASLDLIHRDELYRYIADKHGTPSAILHATAQGGSKGLIRGFFRRASQGAHEILSMSQVYRSSSGALKRLGFREDNYAHNRDLIRFLQRPLEERESVEGLAHAERVGANDETRIWQVEHRVQSPVKGVSGMSTADGIRSGPLPMKFRPVSVSSREALGELGIPSGVEQVRRQGPDMDVNRMLDLLDDPKHAGWDEVFSGAMGRGRLHWENVRSLTYGFHRFLVKNLQTQLPGFMPDLDQRIYRAAQQYAVRHRLVPTGPKAAAKYDNQLIETTSKIVSKMSGDLELRHLEPQLPDSFVRLAKATREAMGIVTEKVAPSSSQIQEIRVLASKLGFSGTPLKQFYRLLTGEDTISNMFQADTVLEALRHWSEKPKVGTGGRVTLRGEPVVPVTIQFQRGKNTPLPELTQRNTDLPATEGRVAPAAAPNQEEVLRLQQEIQGAEHELKGLLKKQETLNAKTSPETALVQKSYRDEMARLKPLKDRIGKAREALKKIPARDDAARAAAKQTYDKLQVELSELRKSLKGQAKATSKPQIQAAKKKLEDAKKAVDSTDPHSLERKAAKARLREAKVLYNQATAPLRTAGGAATEVADTAATVRGAESLDPAKLGQDSIAGVDKQIRDQKLGPPNRELNEQILTARQALSESQRRLKELTSQSPRISGGGLSDAPATKPAYVPTRRLKAARDRLKAAQTPAEIESARAELIRVRASLPDATAPRNAGSTVGIEYYVPESVAKLMKDLEMPGIDPRWPEALKSAVRTYDKFLSVMKSNLMLPHGGYHFRNLYSNVAINYLAPGASLMSPKDGFANLRDWMKVSLYSLYRHSDLGEHMLQDRGRVAKAVHQWGEELITSDAGNVMKVRDLVQQAGLRGVLSGSSMPEILESTMGARASGALGGTGAGLAAGALGGGVAGAVEGALNPSEPSEVGVGWGSLMGAAAGAALGGRRLAGASKAARSWGGGIPLRTADSVTALLQSNWKPFMSYSDAAIESPARLAMFIKSWKETGSLHEAGLRVSEHMNDLFHLSAFERQFARRIVPFYGWLKTAIRQSSHALLENPSGMSSIFKAVENWNAGEDDKPDFLRDKFALVAKWPWQEEAATARVAVGAVPLEDVADLTSFVTADKPAQRLFDSLMSRGPMGFTSALEYMVNRDSFTGQNIIPEPGETSRFERGRDWEGAPGWLRSVVQYRKATDQQKSAVHPGVAWLIGELPVSRFVAFTRQAYDSGGKLNMTVLARQFLGVTAYRFDPKTQRYYENRAKIERMAQLLDNVGQLRKFERYYQKKKDTTLGRGRGR